MTAQIVDFLAYKETRRKVHPQEHAQFVLAVLELVHRGKMKDAPIMAVMSRIWEDN